MRSLKELKCPECGATIENFIVFASCPNMHGKLQNRLTEEEQLMIDASGIPAVLDEEKRGLYRMPDGRLVKFTARFSISPAVKRFRSGQPVARCWKFKGGFGEYTVVDERASEERESPQIEPA